MLEAQGDSAEALAQFCGTYWFPLYTFARRMNLGVADAEDLTQSFFERLLSRDLLGQARRDRGRLRSFLLHAFKNFATEEWRRKGAQKRGGGRPVVAIDALSAEERYALEPHDRATPEVEYERAWARELLRQAVDRLGRDYDAAGNGAVFRALRDQLTEGALGRGYLEIATTLGVSESAARFAAFKLRQRFRGVLREIVAETVAAEDEIDDELSRFRALFGD